MLRVRMQLTTRHFISSDTGTMGIRAPIVADVRPQTGHEWEVF